MPAPNARRVCPATPARRGRRVCLVGEARAPTPSVRCASTAQLGTTRSLKVSASVRCASSAVACTLSAPVTMLLD